MKRRGLALCAGLLLLVLLPGSALALATIDQKNESINDDLLLSGWTAQSFKAGHTGSMTGVDLRLFMNSGTTTVALNIEKLDEFGSPDGTPLVGSSLVVGTTDNWVHFSFQPIGITAGQRYAIVFRPALNCNVRESTANPYADGHALYLLSGHWGPMQGDVNRDLAFRTWMNLPPQLATLAPTSAPPATPTTAATSAPVSTSSLASGESPTPTPAPAESPTAAETAAETAASGPSATGPSATETPVVTATPAPASGSGAGGSSDLTLPIVAAAIAVTAGLAAGLLLVVLRRRRRAAEE